MKRCHKTFGLSVSPKWKFSKCGLYVYVNIREKKETFWYEIPVEDLKLNIYEGTHVKDETNTSRVSQLSEHVEVP